MSDFVSYICSILAAFLELNLLGFVLWLLISEASRAYYRLREVRQTRTNDNTIFKTVERYRNDVH